LPRPPLQGLSRSRPCSTRRWPVRLHRRRRELRRRRSRGNPGEALSHGAGRPSSRPADEDGGVGAAASCGRCLDRIRRPRRRRTRGPGERRRGPDDLAASARGRRAPQWVTPVPGVAVAAGSAAARTRDAPPTANTAAASPVMIKTRRRRILTNSARKARIIGAAEAGPWSARGPRRRTTMSDEAAGAATFERRDGGRGGVVDVDPAGGAALAGGSGRRLKGATSRSSS
jgi:hypothetical protein